jgi:ribosomal protein S27E
MAWGRVQYVKRARRPQHARVNFCTVACIDCGHSLCTTHLVGRFGDRCRSCFDTFWSAAATMAGHYEQVAEE